MDLLNEKQLQREPFPKFVLLSRSNHPVVLLPLEVQNHFDRWAIKEEMFWGHEIAADGNLPTSTKQRERGFFTKWPSKEELPGVF